MRQKSTAVITPDEAVEKVEDGDVVGICSSGGVLDVEPILQALGERYRTTGHPHGITEVSPVIPGTEIAQGGMNHLDAPGLLRRVVTGGYHNDRHPRLDQLIETGKVEGYNLPMGCIFQALEAAGGRRPGVISRVGINTFVDPRNQGGRLNETSPAEYVEEIHIDGERFLFYRALALDVAVIRGTVADEYGNLSLRGEPAYLGVNSLALAAKSNGGLVLAQVSGVVRGDSLDPRDIKVPGDLIDFLIVVPEQEQVSGKKFSPYICGDLRMASLELPRPKPSAQSVILRRSALEVEPGFLVNLGMGIYNGLPGALPSELLDQVSFSIEHGQLGGVPGASVGGAFASAVNPSAIVDSTLTFQMYDGGILDLAFLSFGQVDSHGNVNIGRLGERRTGVGGFINISQGARRVVFGGALTASGLEVRVENDQLVVEQEGKISKFVERVEQVDFAGPYAAAWGIPCLFITERAVFSLDERGIVLTELAPGLRVDDIRLLVGARFSVSPDLRPMPESCFQ